MPLTTVYLLALASGTTVSKYLRALKRSDIEPLVVSKPVRWIIRPEQLSVPELLETTWDLLLILPASKLLPNVCLGAEWVAAQWTVSAGVPKSLVDDFHARNQTLLHPSRGDVLPLTGSLDQPRITTSTQGLELNEELLEWSKDFELRRGGAVSMLNLLAFNTGMHESYLVYGKSFGESIGKRRGGLAKLVGRVVPSQGTGSEDVAGWDEMALAHYPSILHFVDMLASEDYQEVNHRYRLPALRDTCILCTTELDPELLTELAKL